MVNSIVQHLGEAVVPDIQNVVWQSSQRGPRELTPSAILLKPVEDERLGGNGFRI